MTLPLPIKFVVVFWFVFGTLAAQEKPIEYKSVGNLSASFYQPISFGNNFVNRGLSINPGGQLESKFYLGGDLFAGLRITVFGADVTDVTKTGNYQRTTVSSIGFVGGYKMDVLPKLELLLNGEIGLVGYRSQLNNFERFSDNGYTLRATPELHFRATRILGLFLAPEFRYDRLSINTANEFNGYFKNVTYAAFNFGLRITFTNKIYAWELEKDNTNTKIE